MVLISPASVKSDWVPYEIGLAKGTKLKILPFLVHPSIVLPGYLSNLLYLKDINDVRKYIVDLKEGKTLIKAIKKENNAAQTNDIKIPKDILQNVSKLRSKPLLLNTSEVKEMLVDKGYFDSEWNKEASGFNNDFEEICREGDWLIFDRNTGLTWQKKGSDKHIVFEEAIAYTEMLNKDKYGGYRDWRLPTLEEAMTLMKSVKNNNGLYIDTAFSPTQRYIWSIDENPTTGHWGADFSAGYCGVSNPGGRIGHNFVRAVR